MEECKYGYMIDGSCCKCPCFNCEYYIPSKPIMMGLGSTPDGCKLQPPAPVYKDENRETKWNNTFDTKEEDCKDYKKKLRWFERLICKNKKGGCSMRKVLLCLMAVLLLGCNVVMAGEVPVNEWQASVGVGQLFGADLKNGQLLDDRGVCYFADIFPPFELPLFNRTANTKLVFQMRENSTDANVDDFMCGGAIAIKGVNFFSKEVGVMTISSGIDPALLMNLSYAYRTMFEDEPFAIRNLIELDAMVYLKIGW